MIKKIYECVHCPEQKEIEIENAPEFIRCPKCGAEMFPLPYDKIEAIIKLILDYVNSYTIRTLKRNQYTLNYVNKIKIPSFYTVTSALSDAKNFDHYFTILTKQLEKIHLYYNENIESNVKFDFTSLYKEAMRKDQFLIKTCDKLGEEIKLDEIKIPIDAGMYYNNVNYSMIELTNQIINNLFKLSEKIKTIIEENNFYGLDYRKIKQNTDKKYKNHRAAMPPSVMWGVIMVCKDFAYRGLINYFEKISMKDMKKKTSMVLIKEK